ncbi:MAG: circadian clock KaiB family protein [Chthoniobacter sp.]
MPPAAKSSWAPCAWKRKTPCTPTRAAPRPRPPERRNATHERACLLADPPKGAYVFRLYLADGAPNSVRALANLYAICRRHFPDCHRIEIVDVLKEPLRALEESILVTPTVVRISPEPELQIIGNLSDEEEVLRALGLPQREMT